MVNPQLHPDVLRARLDRVRSPAMRSLYERQLQKAEMHEQARMQASGAPQWGQVPPTEAFSGPLVIGAFLSGEPVGLTQEQLAGPLILLIGPPGSGKTTLLNRLMMLTDALGHTVISFATKEAKEHAWGHTLPVLEPEQAALGLRPPAGMSREMLISRVLTLMEQSLWLSSGSIQIRSAIERLSEKLPAPYEPCLQGVLETMTRFKASSKAYSKSAAHRVSAVVALVKLCGGHAMFSGVRPLSWERRLSTSHALRLRDLPAEAIRITVLTYLEAYLGCAGAGTRQLRHLWAIDDARVIARSVKREGQASVDALTRYVDLAQSSGGVIVLSLQHCGEVSPELISSASGVILTGPASDLDLKHLRGRFNLDKDRTEYLRTQAKYHAVVHFRDGLWPNPFPILLAPPPVVEQSVFERERQVRTCELFSGVQVELWRSELLNDTPKPQSTQDRQSTRDFKRDDEGLDPKLHSLLCAVLDQPYLFQDEIGKACKVRGRELTSCRDELQHRGYVKAHRLVRLVIWEPTLEGAKVAGRKLKPLAGRGSYQHKWVQARWCAWMKQSCQRVEVEYTISGIGIVDGYAERDGVAVALEVVLDLSTLERSLEKLRMFTGERVLVVPDQKAVDKVKNQLVDLELIQVMTVREMVKLSVLAE